MQRDWFMYHLRSTYTNRLEYPFNNTIFLHFALAVSSTHLEIADFVPLEWTCLCFSVILSKASREWNKMWLLIAQKYLPNSIDLIKQLHRSTQFTDTGDAMNNYYHQIVYYYSKLNTFKYFWFQTVAWIDLCLWSTCNALSNGIRCESLYHK